MSVTAPEGFVAAAARAGIKPAGEPDLAIVAAQGGAAAGAAVFTSNRAAAAPVQVSRDHLRSTNGRIRAVVLTAGNANAATGREGKRAASRLCELVAARLQSPAEEVLICQTGLIGVPFPLGAVEPNVDGAVASLERGEAASSAAAGAILTTDTVRKEAVVATGRFTVGAMAKGSAMLAPDMATMLAVVTTDAACEPGALGAHLREAVNASFNRMTVDGATSTNDTVVAMANGRAGAVATEVLGGAIAAVCASLAEQMVADAEGATKVVRVRVHGARSDGEAHQAARKVAGSLLVKCSLNGGDPYWGRIVSELGSAGVAFDLDKVDVSYGGVTVCKAGEAVPHDAAAIAEHMGGRHIEIAAELGLGTGTAAILATDLGHGYIDENRTTS